MHAFEGSRSSPLLSTLRAHARSLDGAPGDYAPLVDLLGSVRFALLGEASHGTHEFYAARAEITKQLIVEKGYAAVAVEADWPDAWRVDRFVRGASDDADANAALSGFSRFPGWMWRNRVVLDFVTWLRAHNDRQPPERKVGFYGIDLYSLFTSISAVLEYLDRVDRDAAARARFRYACFDHFAEDTQAYGYAAAFGMKKTCEEAVVKTLVDLTRKAGEHASGADPAQGEAYF